MDTFFKIIIPGFINYVVEMVTGVISIAISAAKEPLSNVEQKKVPINKTKAKIGDWVIY